MNILKLKEFVLLLHKKNIFYILPVVAVLLTYLFTSKSPLSVFPSEGNNKMFKISTYADGSNPEGASIVTEPKKTETSLTYNYTISDKYQYPYAGLSIDINSDSTYLDVSDYNRIELLLSVKNEPSLNIFVKLFNNKFTNKESEFSKEFLQKNFKVSEKLTKIEIPYDDLNHPEWWLEENNLVNDEIKTNFANVVAIQLQNGTNTPKDTAVYTQIKSIRFTKDNRMAIIISAIIASIYFGIYVALMQLMGKKDGSKVVISYEKLNVENDSDQDVERITETIAKNFSNPDFSVDKLSKEAGVSATKIPTVLKERFSMNFKQYLNTIRIAEAKRLLKETDNQIVNIAYTVGYNNIPHFNRTFKQMENVSPKEYRKQNG